ncbi:hypothetical protein V6N13_010474 [Hibiscus sabdariffa]|uniref:Uncharacterized protein n=1 Tax=Hibiscus sabdariffa TaxID=183260 RepID=A0ABR2NVV5_9ROSI
MYCSFHGIQSHLLLSSQFHFSGAQTWVKAGYWYANGEFPTQDINTATAGKSISGEKVNASVLSSSSTRKSFIDSSMKTASRYAFQVLGVLAVMLLICRVFKFSNIKAATNNFSTASRIYKQYISFV